MKKISLYLISTLMMALLQVVVVIICLNFFISFLGELSEIGQGDYNLLQAVFYVLLRLPQTMYQFFPMLALLGGLMGLGQLASRNELMIIRISGVSVKKMAGIVLLSALTIAIVVSAMGELIAPRAIYFADQQKARAQSGGQSFKAEQGIWIHEKNNFIHIHRVLNPHYLTHVTVYRFNKAHQLLLADFARFMIYQGHHWVAYDAQETVFKDHTAKSAVHKKQQWSVSLKPNLLHRYVVRPEGMSLSSLWETIQYLKKNKVESNVYELIFWQRILQPIASVVMLFLGFSFVFCSPRSSTMGWRLMMGILLGFTFYISNALLGQAGIVYQLPAYLAALIPLFIFSLLGYALLIKVC